MNLANLAISPLNSRQAESGPGIEELAQSIQSQGLLQNLVAYENPKKKGQLLVCAGGRRLQALQLLVERGVLDKDMPIPVQEVDIEEAEEISLAENYHREPMHPADEFEAFAKLVKKGRTPLEVAQRFGVEEKHVNRMLKLANVAPVIIEQYKAKGSEVTLDQVMALAVSSDHDKQLSVWKTARGTYLQRPDQLRKALTASQVPASSSLGQFIGIDAYVSAGGTPEPDLFNEEIYLPDATLVKQVALEKLDKRVKQLLKEGWAWATPRLEFPWDEENKFRTAQRAYKNGKREPWDDKVKSYAGAVVTVEDGRMKVVPGLYRPGDEKKAVSKTAADKKADGKVVKDALPKKPAATGFTFAAIQRLQGFRTAVLRNELAVQPRVMLAAMAADMAKRDLLRKYNESQLVHIGQVSLPHDKNVGAGMDTAEEQVTAFDAIEGDWQKRLSAVKGDLFEWLLAQPEEVTHTLLAFLGARTLVAAQTGDLKKDAGYAFQHIAGVDMTGHWKPTTAWLETLTKGVILQILGAFYSKKELEPVAKLGKGDLNMRAEQLLEGKGYLPASLRPKGFNAAWAKKAP